MSLHLELTLTCRQTQALLPGHIDETCLPRSWARFERAPKCDRRAVQKFVFGWTKYRHVLDYLVGLLEPSERPALRAYYRDEGQQMKDLHTDQDLEVIDARMLKRIEVLFRYLGAIRRMSTHENPPWMNFVCCCASLGFNSSWDDSMLKPANDDSDQPVEEVA